MKSSLECSIVPVRGAMLAANMCSSGCCGIGCGTIMTAGGGFNEVYFKPPFNPITAGWAVGMQVNIWGGNADNYGCDDQFVQMGSPNLRATHALSSVFATYVHIDPAMSFDANLSGFEQDCVCSATTTGLSYRLIQCSSSSSSSNSCRTVCVDYCGPCPGSGTCYPAINPSTGAIIQTQQECLSVLGAWTGPPSGCTEGHSSWACCPTETQCLTNTGKAWRVMGYGCDATCYMDTLIVNAKTVATRPATRDELNYQSLFWPPNSYTYGNNCVSDIILIDGTPWWFKTSHLRNFHTCGTFPRDILYGQAPWKFTICGASGPSCSWSKFKSTQTDSSYSSSCYGGAPQSSNLCEAYCIKRILANHSCAANMTTFKVEYQTCRPWRNLRHPRNYGVTQFNYFEETNGCGRVLVNSSISSRILEFRIALIDGLCQPSSVHTAQKYVCSCESTNTKKLHDLFNNFGIQYRKNSAACTCESSSKPNPRGACCVPPGFCIQTTRTHCMTLNGAWKGNGAPCFPRTCWNGPRNPCPSGDPWCMTGCDMPVAPCCLTMNDSGWWGDEPIARASINAYISPFLRYNLYWRAGATGCVSATEAQCNYLSGTWRSDYMSAMYTTHGIYLRTITGWSLTETMKRVPDVWRLLGKWKNPQGAIGLGNYGCQQWWGLNHHRAEQGCDMGDPDIPRAPRPGLGLGRSPLCFPEGWDDDLEFPNYRRCFRAIREGNHTANTDNKPITGVNWRAYWIEVPCCPDSSLYSVDPTPCCTSDCYSSSFTFWQNPSETLNLFWKPSKAYNCNQVVLIQDWNYGPAVEGFCVEACRTTPPSGMAQPWIWPTGQNYFIRYDHRHFTSSSKSNSCCPMSSTWSHRYHYPRKFDTIRFYDASAQRFKVITNTNAGPSSSWVREYIKCAYVSKPWHRQKQRVPHEFVEYLYNHSSSPPCEKCIEPIIISSPSNHFGKICITPWEPGDFTHKDVGGCARATNWSEVTRVNIGYRVSFFAHGYRTQCHFGGPAGVYGNKYFSTLTATPHLINMVDTKLWINAALYCDGGATQAFYGIFKVPKVFFCDSPPRGQQWWPEGWNVINKRNIMDDGRYNASGDCCSSRHSLNHPTHALCCANPTAIQNASAYVNCFKWMVGLVDGRIEYEWHFASDKNHAQYLRDTDYPASAQASWGDAHGPYNKRTGTTPIGCIRNTGATGGVNGYMQYHPGVIRNRVKLFGWKDGECLPGQIVNMRARAIGTCSETGDEMRTVWSYAGIHANGHGFGNIHLKEDGCILGPRHTVGNALDLYGNLKPFQNPMPHFSPNCDLECGKFSSSTFGVLATLCYGSSKGSKIRAQLHPDLVNKYYDRWGAGWKMIKYMTCPRKGASWPKLWYNTLVVARKVNGSLTRECIKVDECYGEIARCDMWLDPPDIHGLIVSWNAANCGGCVAQRPYCDLCENGRWQSLGYDNYTDCFRAKCNRGYWCNPGEPGCGTGDDPWANP